MRPQHPRIPGAEIASHPPGPARLTRAPGGATFGLLGGSSRSRTREPAATGAQAANADQEAAPRAAARASPAARRLEGAEQGRLRGQQGAPLRRRLGAPARRPHPAAGGGDPGAADRGGPRSPRAGGSGVGQAGRGGGLRYSCTYRVCASLLVPGVPPPSRLSLSRSLRTRPRRSGFPAPPPSHLPPRTPAPLAPGTWGRGRRSASGLLPRIPLFYISLVSDLISIKKKSFSYPNHNFMTIDSL